MKTRISFSRLLTFLLLLTLPIGFGCSTGGGSQTTTSWTGTVQTGTRLSDQPAAVTTDAAGNVYVAGGSGGDIDNCGCMNRMDGFVVKYGPSGREEWVAEIEQDAWVYARGIAAPPGKDFLYVTGETDADLTGTGSAPGRMDIFLYRVGFDGTKGLVTQAGTADDDYANAVAADPEGNAYVAGDTFGSLDNNTKAGSRDAFVMKIDDGGNIVWATQIGSADIDIAKAVALDAAGNVYVAGNTFSMLPGADGTYEGGSDLFLAKVSPDGVVKWVRVMGTRGSDIGTSVVVDASGNVFVAGTTAGRFGEEYRVGEGYHGLKDAFVAKFDPKNGEPLWVRLVGTTKDEEGFAVTTGAGGTHVYLAGKTGGNLGAPSSGSYDAFVACLAGWNGELLWVQQIGTSSSDCAHAAAVDAGGGLFVAGSTMGGMEGNVNCGSCDLFVAKFDGSGNEY